MREALALGEFELHYQPFVSVESGRTCGYEALLRGGITPSAAWSCPASSFRSRRKPA
ncbi:hypothetical protein ACU4GH_13260 [Bradyrhizobium betae]